MREAGMSKFICRVQRFLESEDGTAAVEYALVLALIIVVLLTTVATIGTDILNRWQ